MPNRHASNQDYRSLKAKLLALGEEIAAIHAEGEILLDARIDSSKPGGKTVRGTPSIQYRLRVKGQKARYLKKTEVSEKRVSIARGKRLRRREQELQRVQEQLDRLAAIAADLGLELPE